mgnify:CR=1 FL=1
MNGECCCEGLLSINLQGKICVFNSVAAEILEMQREAVLNQPFALHFFDYAENDEFNQIILNFFLQQYAGDMFVVPYFTGQSRKLLFLKCSLVYSQETEIPEKVGMLAAFRDVSHIAEIRNVIKTTADWKMQTGSENIALSEQIPGQVPLVSLKSVSKTYQTGEIPFQALQSTSLDIFPGELVVILGPSGCGKSTLLNLIGGMDQPSTGEISYCGIDLAAAGDRLLTLYRRREVGFVFQFYNLIPDLTAGENILLAAELSENPLPLDMVLEEVGLTPRVNHFPSQLSGGEQQRVSIARALIKQPKLLLCDEPTGALDSKNGLIVLELLERLSRQSNRTVVIVTHNTAIAAIADRIFKMRNGQLVESYRNPFPISVSQVEL